MGVAMTRKAVLRFAVVVRRHQEPFDRLIAAQCLRYDSTLVSVDKQFDGDGVRRVW